MKLTFTTKNFRTYKHLEETIEKKFEKLDKYFSDDIDANLVISRERNMNKLEVTINAKGAVFRAEDTNEDIYTAVDIVVDKLAAQMSKFKGKMQRRWKDNRSVRFETIPTFEEEQEVGKIVRTKKFDLLPMTPEEAVLQMEMLQHDFFVYLDMETDSVNVVYRRKDENYGVLETSY